MAFPIRFSFTSTKFQAKFPVPEKVLVIFFCGPFQDVYRLFFYMRNGIKFSSFLCKFYLEKHITVTRCKVWPLKRMLFYCGIVHNEIARCIEIEQITYSATFRAFFRLCVVETSLVLYSHTSHGLPERL